MSQFIDYEATEEQPMRMRGRKRARAEMEDDEVADDVSLESQTVPDSPEPRRGRPATPASIERKRLAALAKLKKAKAARERAAALEAKNILQAISITVGQTGQDIDPKLFVLTTDFVGEEATAGVVSAERGNLMEFVHGQGVAKFRTTSAAALKNKFFAFLALKADQPFKNLHVSFKVLRNVRLHTWHGMIGYCLKDEGKPGFETYQKEISNEDVEKGKLEFLRHGASDLKGKTALTMNNIVDKAAQYARCRSRNPHMTFDATLLHMAKTGHYFCNAQWITPYSGRGMDLARCDALWKLARRPGDFEPEDVNVLFFGVTKKDRPTDAAPPLDEMRSFANDDDRHVVRHDSDDDVFAENVNFVALFPQRH